MLSVTSVIIKSLLLIIVVLLFAIIGYKWSDAGIFDGVRGQEDEYMTQSRKEAQNRTVRIFAISAMVIVVGIVLIIFHSLLTGAE